MTFVAANLGVARGSPGRMRRPAATRRWGDLGRIRDRTLVVRRRCLRSGEWSDTRPLLV
jgi:hypothetical protein